MGLYEDIQNDIKEASIGELSDAYVSFNITKITSSVYNPSLGELANAEVTELCFGFLVKNSIGDVLDQPESKSGLIFLVLDSVAPFEIKNEQKVTYDAVEYKIVGLVRDPVKSTYSFSCIAWN